jgi:hypothetical protein
VRFSVHFLWFDFWVGAFWDRNQKILYVNPLPCVVLKFDFVNRRKLDWTRRVNEAFDLKHYR